MIETKIDELIAAIERNTAALTASPKAEKPAKPAKPTAEKPAKVEEAAPSGASAARVEEVIGQMLKANKRTEAIVLLASFNGAKSKTGIIEQGQEAMDEFVERAEAILLGA